MKVIAAVAERSPSSGLLLPREEHIAARDVARVRLVCFRDASVREAAILARPRSGEAQVRLVASDASAAARRDEAEDARPVRRLLPGAGAEKLAGRELVGRAPACFPWDESVAQVERLLAARFAAAAQDGSAPDTPGVDPSAA